LRAQNILLTQENSQIITGVKKVDETVSVSDKDKYNLSPLLLDTDGDGLSDYYELQYSATAPAKADTDGDGIPDGIEIVAHIDPLRPLSDTHTKDANRTFIYPMTVGAATMKVAGHWEIYNSYMDRFPLDTQNMPGVLSDAIEVALPKTTPHALLTFDLSKIDVAKWGMGGSICIYEYNPLSGTMMLAGETGGKITDNKLTSEVTSGIYFVADKNFMSADNSTNILFVIDDSGSMYPASVVTGSDENDVNFERVDFAESIIKDMTGALTGPVNYGVGTFTKMFTPLCNITDDSAKAISALESIKSGNTHFDGTNISGAIIDAAKEFEDDRYSRNFIIVVTDGDTTENVAADTQTAIADCEDANISVLTVGIGKKTDSKFLENLAGETGGVYYQAVNSDSLADIAGKVSNLLTVGRMAVISDDYAITELIRDVSQLNGDTPTAVTAPADNVSQTTKAADGKGAGKGTAADKGSGKAAAKAAGKAVAEADTAEALGISKATDGSDGINVLVLADSGFSEKEDALALKNVPTVGELHGLDLGKAIFAKLYYDGTLELSAQPYVNNRKQTVDGYDLSDSAFFESGKEHLSMLRLPTVEQFEKYRSIKNRWDFSDIKDGLLPLSAGARSALSKLGDNVTVQTAPVDFSGYKDTSPFLHAITFEPLHKFNKYEYAALSIKDPATIATSAGDDAAVGNAANDNATANMTASDKTKANTLTAGDSAKANNAAANTTASDKAKADTLASGITAAATITSTEADSPAAAAAAQTATAAEYNVIRAVEFYNGYENKGGVIWQSFGVDGASAYHELYTELTMGRPAVLIANGRVYNAVRLFRSEEAYNLYIIECYDPSDPSFTPTYIYLTATELYFNSESDQYAATLEGEPISLYILKD
jgi:hypothetical protein